MDLHQLAEFAFLFPRQSSKSLFFNEKINSFLAPGKGQLVQTLTEFRSSIKILIERHLGGGQFAEVPALLIMAPAFQQTGCRYSGFCLHGFNKRLQ